MTTKTCLMKGMVVALWLATGPLASAAVPFPGELATDTNWVSSVELGSNYLSQSTLVITGPGNDLVQHDRSSLDAMLFLGPSENGLSLGTTFRFHWKLNAGNSLNATAFFGVGGDNQSLAGTVYGSRPVEGNYRVELLTGDTFAFGLDSRIYKGAAPSLTITPLQQQVDLGVNIIDNVSVVFTGAPHTYSLTVTNYGPDTINDFSLLLSLPPDFLSPVYSNSAGLFNSGNGAWTGLSLVPNSHVTLTLSGVVSPTASTNLVLAATVATSAGAIDSVPSNNNAADTNTVILAVEVSGYVYNDANHNGFKDTSETGTGLTPLYAKIMPAASPSGPASQAVAVNPTTGLFTFTSVTNGNYLIIIDNNNTLADVTPTLPGGWTGTEQPNQKRSNVVVAGVPLPNQNFGLVNAVTVSGTVFNDNGAGGGTANEGIKNGGEAGIPGVTVKLMDNGSTVYDTVTTDASGNFSLLIPGTVANGATLKVVEINLSPYRSTGASVGTTGGSYDRATDAITFTHATGTSRTGLQFGDVKVSIFNTDGQQNGLPGSVVFYAHTFIAATAGQVTFTPVSTSNPNLSGWSQIFYQDSNGNGQVDPGEPVINGPINVVADQKVAIVNKVFIPVNAPFNAQDLVTITASFTYTGANPSLSDTMVHTDLTTVGTPATAGLTLLKAVDKAAALPGENLTYTVTYLNESSGNLANVIIYDQTPAFTTFVSAGNGPLPSGLTGVTIISPSVGGTGAIRWTFTGSLQSAGTGTVTFQVKIE